jgi:hypothetical protein
VEDKATALEEEDGRGFEAEEGRRASGLVDTFEGGLRRSEFGRMTAKRRRGTIEIAIERDEEKRG